MTKPTPIRTMDEIKEYLASNFIAPYQSFNAIYGALRVFYEQEEIDAAHLKPKMWPMPYRSLVPPPMKNDATVEDMAVYAKLYEELNADEGYCALVRASITTDDFIDWLSGA